MCVCVFFSIMCSSLTRPIDVALCQTWFKFSHYPSYMPRDKQIATSKHILQAKSKCIPMRQLSSLPSYRLGLPTSLTLTLPLLLAIQFKFFSLFPLLPSYFPPSHSTICIYLITCLLVRLLSIHISLLSHIRLSGKTSNCWTISQRCPGSCNKTKQNQKIKIREK